MAGRGGFEPPLRGPEPRVLPLDDLPASQRFYAGPRWTVKARALPPRARPAAAPALHTAGPALPLQHRVLQRAARLEAGHPAGGDLDGLPRSGVAAVAAGALAHQERAEAADGDLAALLEGVRNVLEERVEGALRGD